MGYVLLIFGFLFLDIFLYPFYFEIDYFGCDSVFEKDYKIKKNSNSKDCNSKIVTDLSDEITESDIIMDSLIFGSSDNIRNVTLQDVNRLKQISNYNKKDYY
jgi:hypothetical protein